MAAKRRRAGTSQSTNIPLVIGTTLVVGLALGALLYRGIHHHKTEPIAAVTVHPHPVYAPPPPPPKPKGPGPGLPAATQFDFYTILPEIHRKSEGVFPHAHQGPKPTAAKAATPGAAPQPPITAARGSFILQAASFPDVVDANRLRARLTLRGLAPYIEEVSITGRGAFFRVRLGPLQGAALAHDRKILGQLGLKPILLREAPGN
ncbi:MAG TPA: SPOR domain-containing protein [Acidiferrobacter sp.]|nr:SPOR domain-containing protein [Acidiferrobacter sp.]